MFAALYAGAVYGVIGYGTRRAANYTTVLSESLAASDSAGMVAIFTAAVADAIAASDLVPALLYGNEVLCDVVACADNVRFQFYPFHPRTILGWEEEDRDEIIAPEARAGETAAYRTPPARADSRKLTVDQEARTTNLNRIDRVF